MVASRLVGFHAPSLTVSFTCFTYWPSLPFKCRFSREIADEKTLTPKGRAQAVRHLINRSILLGGGVATGLSLTTWLQKESILNGLTTNPDIRAAAASIMPIVLVTQGKQRPCMIATNKGRQNGCLFMLVVHTNAAASSLDFFFLVRIPLVSFPSTTSHTHTFLT